METEDNVYTMEQVAKTYKKYGGQGKDGREIWDELQTSINNFGNNGNNPKSSKIFLLEGQTEMLLLTLGFNSHITSEEVAMLHQIIADGYYMEEDRELLNEIRRAYIKENK